MEAPDGGGIGADLVVTSTGIASIASIAVGTGR